MELIFIVLVIVFDQVTKYIAKSGLQEGTITLIKDYFELVYVENRGAAFGLFQNMKFLLVGITSIVIIIMIYYLFKNRKMDIVLRISLILIIGGAIGNLIDRIILGYVIDFFHFYMKDFFDFPVFNVADISVVCGTILLSIKLLFEKEQ
jgi:signal peptidase II